MPVGRRELAGLSRAAEREAASDLLDGAVEVVAGVDALGAVDTAVALFIAGGELPAVLAAELVPFRLHSERHHLVVLIGRHAVRQVYLRVEVEVFALDDGHGVVGAGDHQPESLDDAEQERGRGHSAAQQVGLGDGVPAALVFEHREGHPRVLCKGVPGVVPAGEVQGIAEGGRRPDDGVQDRRDADHGALEVGAVIGHFALRVLLGECGHGLPHRSVFVGVEVKEAFVRGEVRREAVVCRGEVHDVEHRRLAAREVLPRRNEVGPVDREIQFRVRVAGFQVVQVGEGERVAVGVIGQPVEQGPEAAV